MESTTDIPIDAPNVRLAKVPDALAKIASPPKCIWLAIPGPKGNLIEMVPNLCFSQQAALDHLDALYQAGRISLEGVLKVVCELDKFKLPLERTPWDDLVARWCIGEEFYRGKELRKKAQEAVDKLVAWTNATITREKFNTMFKECVLEKLDVTQSGTEFVLACPCHSNGYFSYSVDNKAQAQVMLHGLTVFDMLTQEHRDKLLAKLANVPSDEMEPVVFGSGKTIRIVFGVIHDKLSTRIAGKQIIEELFSLGAEE